LRYYVGEGITREQFFTGNAYELPTVLPLNRGNVALKPRSVAIKLLSLASCLGECNWVSDFLDANGQWAIRH